MKTSKPTTFFLAAGGTGGHLFPAEALAQELLDRGHKVVIATDKRGDHFKSLTGDVTVKVISAATFQGGVLGRIKSGLRIAVGIAQSLALLLKHRPVAVVGFGGYPSFPPMLAAQMIRTPTILHEQNSVLGKANKVLAVLSRKLALSFPGTRSVERYEKKAVVTGNPVRKSIIALQAETYAAPKPGGSFRVFITGGSQGAKSFGTIVPDAVRLLPDDFKKRLHIVQQCQEAQVETLAAAYKDMGVTAEVKAFFNDIPDQMKNAQLFVGRAGATTVAEIGVAGLPALFVPDPRHSDLQQKFNAQCLTDRGAGWIMMQE